MDHQRFKIPRDPKQPEAGRIPREDWDRAPWNRWTFQHVREMLPTATVWRGAAAPRPLPSALVDLDGIRFEAEGRTFSLARFLDEDFTDGFLVLHRGSIVAEHYANGMTPRTTHLSQSVAKSVVGSVGGILIARGLIDPAAPLSDYMPELERTAYRGATVQHLLDMTSGVLFDETYTALDSHMAKLDAAAGWKERRDESWPRTVWELVLSLTELECPHGQFFRYRSIETDVLAFVLQRVTGLPLAELVSREIWVPIGAEEDGYFTVDASGYALADGGFNATLGDYARFAMMLADGGAVGGRQVVPAAWIEETRRGDRTRFDGEYLAVLPRGAFHNQFWIEDDVGRALLCRGVFGQFIYVDPEADFAAVKLSSWPDFVDPARTRTAIAAIHAVRDALVGG